MTIVYEWDIETVDTTTGDIVDHYHEDTLSDLVTNLERWDPEPNERYRLVLVRDVRDDCGVQDRAWWYVEDNPAVPGVRFDDLGGFVFGNGAGGVQVPRKYLREFKRYATRINDRLKTLNSDK